MTKIETRYTPVTGMVLFMYGPTDEKAFPFNSGLDFLMGMILIQHWMPLNCLSIVQYLSFDMKWLSSTMLLCVS